MGSLGLEQTIQPALRCKWTFRADNLPPSAPAACTRAALRPIARPSAGVRQAAAAVLASEPAPLYLCLRSDSSSSRTSQGTEGMASWATERAALGTPSAPQSPSLVAYPLPRLLPEETTPVGCHLTPQPIAGVRRPSEENTAPSPGACSASKRVEWCSGVASALRSSAGSGAFGQLGNGEKQGSSSPVAVSGGHLFQSITAGTWFTCGIDTSGKAWCFGAGENGQLGNSMTTDAVAPVPVSGAHIFLALDAGADHACGIKADGSTWCFGELAQSAAHSMAWHAAGRTHVS